MATRVLVTYASKHGSTSEVGERIALALIKRGLDADALPVKLAGNVNRYDGVLIGSSVYFGRWMREAVAFVERNRAQLLKRSVWLFSVGPLEGQERTDPAEITGLAASLKTVEHRLFAGVLDKSQLSIVERALIKGVKAPYGDFRDWDEIDSWAATIAEKLRSAAPVT